MLITAWMKQKHTPQRVKGYIAHGKDGWKATGHVPPKRKIKRFPLFNSGGESMWVKFNTVKSVNQWWEYQFGFGQIPQLTFEHKGRGVSCIETGYVYISLLLRLVRKRDNYKKHFSMIKGVNGIILERLAPSRRYIPKFLNGYYGELFVICPWQLNPTGKPRNQRAIFR